MINWILILKVPCNCKQAQISLNTTQTVLMNNYVVHVSQRCRSRQVKRGKPIDRPSVTFRCEVAPSELPMTPTTALLQQEPHQRETWERENWPPAETENMRPFFLEDFYTAACHSDMPGWVVYFFPTLSMLRSFICKTRSSTGLRVISASENKLKSANTADEYSLQKHDRKRETNICEYEGNNYVIILSHRFKVLTCSSVPALFVQLYLPSDWLRPVKSTWPWKRKLRSLGRRNVSWLDRSRPHTWFQGWSETSRPRWWLPHTDGYRVEGAWIPAGKRHTHEILKFKLIYCFILHHMDSTATTAIFIRTDLFTFELIIISGLTC